MKNFLVVLKTVEMEFSPVDINNMLSTLYNIISVFKGTVDNSAIGFFIEFLEYCQTFKGSGMIQDDLLDKVVNEFSTVRYVM